jgi:hypothetical protein
MGLKEAEGMLLEYVSGVYDVSFGIAEYGDAIERGYDPKQE